MGMSLLVLDTDHLSALDLHNEASARLLRRLEATSHPLVTTVARVEEQMRGWLAIPTKTRKSSELIEPYRRLQLRIETFARWNILPWDEHAIGQFNRLKPMKLRVGTMDMRIACIALEHDATLLSRNLRDFTKIPGLRVENWLTD